MRERCDSTFESNVHREFDPPALLWLNIPCRSVREVHNYLSAVRREGADGKLDGFAAVIHPDLHRERTEWRSDTVESSQHSCPEPFLRHSFE